MSKTATAFILVSLMAIGPLQVHANQDPSPVAGVNMLIVVGAAGTPEYGNQFAAWAGQWASIGEQAGAKITQIGLDPVQDVSDAERLQMTIAAIQESEAKSSRPHWLIFIGHGTFQANVAKLNLRGPDVDAKQLAQWLAPLQQPIVFVNVASASGPFVNALSGPNRIIVTATKSGAEQNFARFGAYLPKALADPASDLDHDDEVSLLEAVLKAASETSEFYAAEARIRTEHAILDDNGDSLGTPAELFGSVLRGTVDESSAPTDAVAGPTDLDGDVAAKTILIPATDVPPLTREEYAERTCIEAELLALRGNKASLGEDEYFKQVEEWMLQLAAIYRAAENREKSTASSP